MEPADELDAATRTALITPELRPVDILMVVDDSCSMGDDQGRLLSFIPILIEPLEAFEVDYHIGTTTTDCDENVWCGIISWLDSDLVENLVLELTPLVQVGTGGSGAEQGSKALAYALHQAYEGGANWGFFRSGEPLEVIVITDEPDSSTDRMQTTVMYRELNDFVERLDKDVRIHVITQNDPGLVYPNPQYCWAPYTADYLDLASATGGKVQNICDANWAPVMDEIAQEFIRYQYIFLLSRLPVSGTVSVLVETDCCTVNPRDEYPEAWHYDQVKNAVVLDDFPLDIIRRVVIQYTVAGQP